MVMTTLPSGARAESRDRTLDEAIIGAIQGGLPLVERPYAAIGRAVGIKESRVIERIAALLADGSIKRLGVVVRHQELGYRANAMVVWDLPDPLVDTLGTRIGAIPFVTLCYRRPRRLPDWPYNLFTMIHGRSREGVLEQVGEVEQVLGLGAVAHAVLFSGRRFKQRGALYRGPRDVPDLPLESESFDGTAGSGSGKRQTTAAGAALRAVTTPLGQGASA
jgi:DNA-binding Lrp family transcriptional regulator